MTTNIETLNSLSSAQKRHLLKQLLSEKSDYQSTILNMRNICRQEMIAAHDDLDINLTNWRRKPNQKDRGK